MDRGDGNRAELWNQTCGLNKQRVLELYRIRRTERASHLKRQEIVSSVRKTYEDFVQKASGYPKHWRVSPRPPGSLSRNSQILNTRLRALKRPSSDAGEKQKDPCCELAEEKTVSENRSHPLETLTAPSTLSSSRVTLMSLKTACSSPTPASPARNTRVLLNLRKEAGDADTRSYTELPLITSQWHLMAPKSQQMISKGTALTFNQWPDVSLSSVDTHTPSELRALSLLTSRQASTTTTPRSSQTTILSRSHIVFNSWGVEEGESETRRLTEFPLVPHTFPKPPTAPKRNLPKILTPTKEGNLLSPQNCQEAVSESGDDELDSLSEPAQSISGFFQQLQSDNWTEKLQDLSNIETLAKQDTYLQVSVLEEEVDEHDSTVACEAIDTISESHDDLDKTMDPDTESTDLSSLVKFAQDTQNTFVQQPDESYPEEQTFHFMDERFTGEDLMEPDDTEAETQSCHSRPNADVLSKTSASEPEMGGRSTSSPRPTPTSPKGTPPRTHQTSQSAQRTFKMPTKKRGQRPNKGDNKEVPLQQRTLNKPTAAPKRNQTRNSSRPLLAYGEAPKKRGPRRARNRQFQKGSSRSRKAQQTTSPSQNLSLFFQQLSSDDWNKKLQGLRAMKTMARRSPGVLQSKLHQVCCILGEEVGKLQFHCAVACEAINAIAALHHHLGEAMDREAEMTGRTLLMKLAQTNNKLIHLQVNLALDALVKGCSPAKVLSSLASPGLSHWCVSVRISVAKHLHQLADIVGEEFILAPENMISERYLRAVSKMATDGAAEVRIHGREMLRRLDPARKCKDLWVKIVSHKDKHQLDQVLTKILWRR